MLMPEDLGPRIIAVVREAVADTPLGHPDRDAMLARLPGLLEDAGVTAEPGARTMTMKEAELRADLAALRADNERLREERNHPRLQGRREVSAELAALREALRATLTGYTSALETWGWPAEAIEAHPTVKDGPRGAERRGEVNPMCSRCGDEGVIIGYCTCAAGGRCPAGTVPHIVSVVAKEPELRRELTTLREENARLRDVVEAAREVVDRTGCTTSDRIQDLDEFRRLLADLPRATP